MVGKSGYIYLSHLSNACLKDDLIVILLRVVMCMAICIVLILDLIAYQLHGLFAGYLQFRLE